MQQVAEESVCTVMHAQTASCQCSVSMRGWLEGVTHGSATMQVVGDSRCPIVDTWWQTETGSHLITPLPGATPLKPGSATLPFFGVEPAVLNEKGEELEGEAEG